MPKKPTQHKSKHVENDPKAPIIAKTSQSTTSVMPIPVTAKTQNGSTEMNKPRAPEIGPTASQTDSEAQRRAQEKLEAEQRAREHDRREAERREAEERARVYEYQQRQRIERRRQALVSQLGAARTEVTELQSQYASLERSYADRCQTERQLKQELNRMQENSGIPVPFVVKVLPLFIAQADIQRLMSHNVDIRVEDVGHREAQLRQEEHFIGDVENMIRKARSILGEVKQINEQQERGINSKIQQQIDDLKQHLQSLKDKSQKLKDSLRGHEQDIERLFTRQDQAFERQVTANRNLQLYLGRNPFDMEASLVAKKVVSLPQETDKRELIDYQIAQKFSDRYFSEVERDLSRFGGTVGHFSAAVSELTQNIAAIDGKKDMLEQDLRERQQEDRRLANYRQHVALLKQPDLSAELQQLERLVRPIARFNVSSEQGTPVGEDGDNLVARSIQLSDISYFEKLLSLGYDLDIPHAGSKNPIDMLLQSPISGDSDKSLAFIETSFKTHPLRSWAVDKQQVLVNNWMLNGLAETSSDSHSGYAISALDYSRLQTGITWANGANINWSADKVKASLLLPQVEVCDATVLNFLLRQLQGKNQLHFSLIADEARARLLRTLDLNNHRELEQLIGLYTENSTFNASLLFSDLNHKQYRAVLERCFTTSTRLSRVLRVSVPSDELIDYSVRLALQTHFEALDMLINTNQDSIRGWVVRNMSSNMPGVKLILAREPSVLALTGEVLSNEVINLAVEMATEGDQQFLKQSVKTHLPEMKKWFIDNVITRASQCLLIICQSPEKFSPEELSACLTNLHEMPALEQVNHMLAKDVRSADKAVLLHRYAAALIERSRDIDELISTFENIKQLELSSDSEKALFKRVKVRMLRVMEGDKDSLNDDVLERGREFLSQYRIFFDFCCLHLPWTMFKSASSQAYDALRNNHNDKFQNLMSKAEERLTKEDEIFLPSP